VKVTETKFKGCYIIEPIIFEDERGLFYESYQKEKFEALIGQKIDFVQDNQSTSKKGVLRGLHFQEGEFAQAKLVKVVKGKAIDVIVDIRRDSETFGQHFKIELSELNKKMLFIPRGFAHGFLALSGETIFDYKCDNYYNKNAESGIIYNDNDLNIDWEYSPKDIIFSEKDMQLPPFKSFVL